MLSDSESARLRKAGNTVRYVMEHLPKDDERQDDLAEALDAIASVLRESGVPV